MMLRLLNLIIILLKMHQLELNQTGNKTISLNKAVEIRHQLSKTSNKVIMTNGCFDLLHRGHVKFLAEAKARGDILFVAVNSDQSIKNIKGMGRPIIEEEDRCFMLAALSCVDYVILFDELTPIKMISALLPDILIKGSGWEIDEIVGREIIESSGGHVITIERDILNDETFKYSTTKIIQKVESLSTNKNILTSSVHDNLVQRRFKENIETIQKTVATLSTDIFKAAELCISSLQKRKKILICGNGGSASQSEHFAAELVCQFHEYRAAIAAIALTSNTSNLTAIGNDLSYENVFSRQIEAIANEQDILIVISTKGRSRNVINAVKSAQKLGVTVIGLLGCDGGALKELCDCSIIVPSDNTARIQEVHLTISHIIVELIEKEIFS